MFNATLLGRIDTGLLEPEFGKIKTDELIITDERLEHIRTHHPEDLALFEKYGAETAIKPDMIIKDMKNKGTVFMIKRLPDTNLSVIIRLVIGDDDKNLKNSVMTFYRIRNKNLEKLKKSNKILYNNE